MQPYPFNQLFSTLPNGNLTPTRVIKINGITLGPGISFGPGTSFGGFDFFKVRDRNLAGEMEGNILVIKGYYGTPV